MEADPESDLRVTYPLEGVQKQLCHFGYQGQLKTNNEPDILKQRSNFWTAPYFSQE
jgi:hypothetical protein